MPVYELRALGCSVGCVQMLDPPQISLTHPHIIPCKCVSRLHIIPCTHRGLRARRDERPSHAAPAGPLTCNCSVTVLNCAHERANSLAAAAAARALGKDPAAAAKAAQRRVWLSPMDALTLPAIACAPNDATTVMRVFYGAKGAARCAFCPRAWPRTTIAGLVGAAG